MSRISIYSTARRCWTANLIGPISIALQARGSPNLSDSQVIKIASGIRFGPQADCAIFFEGQIFHIQLFSTIGGDDLGSIEIIFMEEAKMVHDMRAYRQSAAETSCSPQLNTTQTLTTFATIRTPTNGEGYVSVFNQIDSNQFEHGADIPTAKGARTSLFVPDQNLLYLAVPHRGAQQAEIRVYSVN